MYTELRDDWLKRINCNNLISMQPSDEFKLVLNEPENVRQTAQYIVKAMDLRSNLNKQY